MLSIMVPVAIAMVIIDISRLKQWRLWKLFEPMINSMAREHELKGDFTGATYILVTSCIVIALFDKPIAMAALAFIMVGDAAAALIGRKFGKHKFGNKSLEGSLAFFITALVVVFVIPGLPYSIGIVGALFGAITEAVSTKIDDNASVPLVSGLLMQLLMVIW